MADYKRETRQVYFKNRKVHDPSKQLFEESRAQAQSDKAFITDMEKTGKAYSKALDNWNKNLTELGKEEAEFFKTVTPTLTKFFSEDLIAIGQMRVEAADDKIINDFKLKSSEEQQSLRNGYAETFAKLGLVDAERGDAEAAARELNTVDSIAFAEYLKAHSNRHDTAIFKMLMGEKLDVFDNTLREALQSTEKKYVQVLENGDKVEFSGSEVGSDLDRLAIVLDEENSRFYRATQVGGINTDIIAAYSEEKLKQKTDLVRSEELKKINIRSAKENITRKLSGVEASLSEINLDLNDDDEWVFKRGEDGEISPDVKQTLEGALQYLEREAYNAGFDNPQQYAYEQLGKRLKTIANGDDRKIKLFDQMLGVYGKDHPNAILLEHSDGRGKVTFGQLNDTAKSIFGGNGRSGSWRGNTEASTDNNGTGVENTEGSPAFVENWLQKKWSPPGLKEDGLWDLKDSAWEGTYKREIAEMVLNGDSTAKIEARLREIADEAKENGASDQMVIDILNLSPPKSEQKLQNFLTKNVNSLVQGNEIHIKDLEGYFVNKRTMNEWLKDNKNLDLQGVVIVDEYTQSSDEISAAEDKVFKVIESLDTSGSAWTPGKEAILDEIIQKAMKTSKSNDISFNEALNATLDEYRDANTGPGDTTHEWYQAKNGGYYRFKGHHWQWTTPDRREEFRSDVAQANERRLDMVKRGLTAFSKEELGNIAEEFTTTGTLPLEFLTVAANATKDKDGATIMSYLNSLMTPELKAKYGDNFVETEDLKEILRIFPPNKLNTLYKLTKGKSFDYSSSNDFNLIASRIINQEINKDLSRRTRVWGWNPLNVSWEDPRPVLPNQGGMMNTFKAGFNNGAGDTQAVIKHEDGRVQLGAYGINEQDAARIWNLLNIDDAGYSQEKFKNSSLEVQQKIAKHFVSELIDIQLHKNIGVKPGDNTSNVNTANRLLTGSEMTRGMIHQFLYGTGSEFSDNEVGSDVFNSNNNYLLLYDTYNNGGTVYDYNWRTRKPVAVNETKKTKRTKNNNDLAGITTL